MYRNFVVWTPNTVLFAALLERRVGVLLVGWCGSCLWVCGADPSCHLTTTSSSSDHLSRSFGHSLLLSSCPQTHDHDEVDNYKAFN